MSNSGAIRAGRAFVELFVDDSQMQKQMRNATQRMKGFERAIGRTGQSMMRSGAVMLAPLALAVRSFTKMGDELDKMSRKTGTSVEWLSAMKFAASQSGTSIDGLAKTMKRMNVTIFDASEGLGESVDSLASLGLVASDLQGLAPEKQFEMIADALSRVEDKSTRAALAQKVFGRGGVEILPMIEDGAAGMKKYADEAERLGIIMSTEDAKAAAELTDTLDKLGQTTKMAAFEVGAALAPAISEMAEDITEGMPAFREWMSENRELVSLAAQVAAGMLAVGAAMVVASKGVMVVRTAMIALSWTMANPLLAAVAAIGALLVLNTIEMNKIKDTTSELADEMSKLREESDQLRSADLKRMEQLDELSKKTSLSNTEQATARDIIAQLTERYGDLGVSINGTTGAIEGMADAQKNLRKGMRIAALSELSGEAEQAKFNLDELRATQKDRAENFWATTSEEEFSGLNKKISIALQKTHTLRLRMMALKGELGDSSTSDAVLTGDATQRGTGAPIDPSISRRLEAEKKATAEAAKKQAAADKSQAEMKEELDQKNYALRLERIDDEFKREVATIHFRYDLAIEKLKEAGAVQATIDIAERNRALELGAAKAKAQKIANEEVHKGLEKQNEIDRKRADAIQSRQETVEELKLRVQFKGGELEKKLMDLREHRATAAAKKAGEGTAGVREEFDLLRQLAEQGRSAQVAVRGATGGFSAANLSRGLGPNSTQQKQLDALLGIGISAKKTATNTAKTQQGAVLGP